MEKSYRVIVECYDKNSPETVLSQCSVLEGDINKPTNCMDFTLGIEKQIALLQNVQDYVILEKASLLNQDKKSILSNFPGKLIFNRQPEYLNVVELDLLKMS